MFDKAWYLQPTGPPAAQLLYNLGLEAEDPQETTDNIPPPLFPIKAAHWPPMAPPAASVKKWTTAHHPQSCPLPLRASAIPVLYAKTARTTNTPTGIPIQAPTNKELAANLVTQYLIGRANMATIYMSPDPYHQAFEEELNLCKFDIMQHSTAGLSFAEHNKRLMLASMSPHTPGN